MTVAIQVFLIGLVSTPSQLLALWDTIATARLDARVAAMQRAGEPTALAELAELYPEPPEGQNAADLYRAAFEKMDAIQAKDNGEDLPIVGNAELPPPGQAPVFMCRSHW
jgi:hypothetical protein